MLTFNASDMMWINFWATLAIIVVHVALLSMIVGQLRRIASALESRRDE